MILFDLGMGCFLYMYVKEDSENFILPSAKFFTVCYFILSCKILMIQVLIFFIEHVKCLSGPEIRDEFVKRELSKCSKITDILYSQISLIFHGLKLKSSIISNARMLGLFFE